MTNALQVFNYKAKEVRTTIIDGEIWFVAKDVCDVLEIKNARDAVSMLDDDEKMTVDNSDGHSGQRGGAQSYNVINEAGLYALVFRSNKPEAKEFSRWVRHDVLPSIRQTGSYAAHKDNPSLPVGTLEGAKLIFETAGIKDNQLILAMDKIYRHHMGYSALTAGEIQLIAPTQEQLLTPTEIGREFSISARRVNDILAGAGYQHKISDKWEAIGDGESYAVMLDTGKKHSDGTAVRQLKWSSGILPIFERMLQEER